MANETHRWKGAIEPKSSGTPTINQTYRWKGAIEPAPVVATGRIMSSMAKAGGLAGKGGIAGRGGGLAG